MSGFHIKLSAGAIVGKIVKTTCDPGRKKLLAESLAVFPRENVIPLFTPSWIGNHCAKSDSGSRLKALYPALYAYAYRTSRIAQTKQVLQGISQPDISLLGLA
jgi:hypothetical protein